MVANSPPAFRVRGRRSRWVRRCRVRSPVSAALFVDGVEYATTSAQVSVDGQSATESQLRVGYSIVTLRGTLNADGKTGSATSVIFSQDLRGPVTQLDATATTFVVLGQTVRVNDATLFDDRLQPADFTSLQNDAVVQVSGFADASGALIANRIRLFCSGWRQAGFKNTARLNGTGKPNNQISVLIDT